MKEMHVVLMSGGLDSTTVAALARSKGHDVRPLLVDYGQRHRVELDRAREMAATLACLDPVLVRVDLRAIGGSALTDKIQVPKDRTHAEIGIGVPSTYVPCRNLVMLSLAYSLAERGQADAVGVGVNVLDYSGYPDCRPAFIEAFSRAAPLACDRAKPRLEAPLIEKSKLEILTLARSLGVPVERTWSCYDPQGSPGHEVQCGRCDSCLLRLHAESLSAASFSGQNTGSNPNS